MPSGILTARDPHQRNRLLTGKGGRMKSLNDVINVLIIISLVYLIWNQRQNAATS
jgi:hypothetical protein